MTQIATGNEPFSWMDKQDDDAIIAELKGRKSTALVYEFPMEGKPIRGLSRTGVEEAVRAMAIKHGEVIRIIGDPRWVLNGEYYEVTVIAARFGVSKDGLELPLDTTIGAKRQWIKMKLRDGTIKPDEFAFEKAISKAVRNAKRALMPVDIQEAIIARGLTEGRVTRREDGEEPKADNSSEFYCKEHKTTWFKRGAMKNYAHPISEKVEGQKQEWCNMPKAEPAPATKNLVQATQQGTSAMKGLKDDVQAQGWPKPTRAELLRDINIWKAALNWPYKTMEKWVKATLPGLAMYITPDTLDISKMEDSQLAALYQALYIEGQEAAKRDLEEGR